ncbi:MAG: PQQ-binding-like beta-propeller repeat protein, partial [Bacteroidales bacterium]|nr:PQQ-binding-like beta-propeller repeat protein [Bacteroidales bacterium]
MKNLRLATLALAMGFAGALSAQKFAILTDLHVTPGNANEAKLAEVVEEINKSDVDYVLTTGDLTNEGSDEQLHNVKRVLDALTKPYYIIPGNHENNWSQSACKTFNDLWGQDRFVFTVGNLVVVGMNCGPFMKMGDGHIKQEDLIWLDQTLAEKVKPGMKVLSVNHYPILDDLDNYRDYVAILKKYPVITHQCGHYHRWRLYETEGINGLIVRALDMGNGDFGYTLMNVDLNTNWIHVYNKPLKAASVPMYAYKMNTDYYTSPAPEAQPTISDPRFTVEKVFADNATIFTRLGIDERNIYFGNSLGYCKALDKATKQVKWEYKTSAMLYSRPAVDRKYVVLPTADRRLVWLDKQSGKEVFAHQADGPYVADGVIEKGILYQGGYKTFQAWDVAKRKLIWRYDSINNYCQAAPMVDGGDVVFGAWDTYLRSLNKKTGQLQWKWSNGKTANLLSPGNVVPVVTADKVVVVAPDRVATAVDRRSGEQIWREKNENKVRESLGRSADGKVAYGKTMDGELVAMSTEGSSYKLLWKTDLGLGYEHAPCLVIEHDGFVYAGSRHGRLSVVDASTHKLVVSYSMGSSEVNGFEVDANGDVYCSLI